MPSFDDLHAPLMPILRHVLRSLPLPRAGVALDLACGAGHKAPLLAEALGPAVRLVGADIDRGAVAAARVGVGAEHAPRLGAEHAPRPTDSLHPPAFVVGDAQALPLRDACLDAAFCIAALGLFAEPPRALGELRRALRPGGLALVVTAEQRWAQVTRWPAGLAARLCEAYRQALAAGGASPSAEPAGDLVELLRGAGFASVEAWAFLLEEELEPLAAALPLVPWPALRPLVAGRLASAELAECEARAAEPEIELRALALAVAGR